MWAVEGLTHRYPTKVLAELIPTCPQYCGHCTRMDLVGNDTMQVLKYKFEQKQNDRWDAMLEYLARTPQVRDVVVSGGDMANVPAKRLQEWLFKLMDIENIRDIRIATKGLMGIPQHFLQDDVLEAYDAIATRARERDIDVAIHTHVNAAQQVTPLVGTAVRKLLDMGYRDVRNQGVLLRGVNTTPNQLLELCFTLLDHGKILPYYFYMCDMIPNAEHWRLSVWEAQQLQYAILGYLPGFATPRFVCDVPFVGKRWVHMLDDYDRTRGHQLLAEELPHRHRVRRPGGAHPPVPLLRPDRDAARGGQEWWRKEIAAGPGRPARRALCRAGHHGRRVAPTAHQRNSGDRRRWRRRSAASASAARAVSASSMSSGARGDRHRQAEQLAPRRLDRVVVPAALQHRVDLEGVGGARRARREVRQRLRRPLAPPGHARTDRAAGSHRLVLEQRTRRR